MCNPSEWTENRRGKWILVSSFYSVQALKKRYNRELYKKVVAALKTMMEGKTVSMEIKKRL